ncbi:hypothetical protein [Nonlabens sp. Asnod3-A02]|uniref:hypothetical protein n=1 Tax=Nonlabens sp. Asnod3-A02 TaxID=3160579 RepID=UPI0038707FFA
MNKLLLITSCLITILINSTYLNAQVGVNTTSIDPSAVLEVTSTDKGILIPRVALIASDNVVTPITNPAAGLFVFNTATSNTPSSNSVSPGYYYFNGIRWKRIFNNGFTLEFKQTAELMGLVSSQALPVPGLDTGRFTVPFKGTYQISVTCYYTAGDPINNSDAACQGDFRLYQVEDDNSRTFLEMAYSMSESKFIPQRPGEFNNLGNQFTLIHNIDLEANTSYQFLVAGSQWLCHNTNVSYFGKDTSNYEGSNGITEGQYGELTISLVEQK